VGLHPLTRVLKPLPRFQSVREYIRAGGDLRPRRRVQCRPIGAYRGAALPWRVARAAPRRVWVAAIRCR